MGFEALHEHCDKTACALIITHNFITFIIIPHAKVIDRNRIAHHQVEQ
jgi:hypothetical protein